MALSGADHDHANVTINGQQDSARSPPVAPLRSCADPTTHPGRSARVQPPQRGDTSGRRAGTSPTLAPTSPTPRTTRHQGRTGTGDRAASSTRPKQAESNRQPGHHAARAPGPGRPAANPAQQTDQAQRETGDPQKRTAGFGRLDQRETFPALRQDVHTLTRCAAPLMVARTR